MVIKRYKSKSFKPGSASASELGVMSHKTTNMTTQRKRIYSPSLEELASTSWHFTEITKYHNSAIELADKIPDHDYDKVGQFILKPVAKIILQPRCQRPLPTHQALPVHLNPKRARTHVESAAERLSGDPQREGLIVKLLREYPLREPAGKKGMIIKWARNPVKRTRLCQCNRFLRLPTAGPTAAA